MTPAVEQMIDDVIRREGGFVDHPHDRGGPTNFGITQATLSRHLGRPASVADVRRLSRATREGDLSPRILRAAADRAAAGAHSAVRAGCRGQSRPRPGDPLRPAGVQRRRLRAARGRWRLRAAHQPGRRRCRRARWATGCWPRWSRSGATSTWLWSSAARAARVPQRLAQSPGRVRRAHGKAGGVMVPLETHGRSAAWVG